MKTLNKIILTLILLSAFLGMSACTSASKPKASFCPKCAGSLIIDEVPFRLDMDFTAKEKCIILSGSENPYSSHYYFSENGVRLVYDELETRLDLNALPQTNPAVLSYRVFSALDAKSTKWERVKETYHFRLNLNGVAVSGICSKDFKVQSFEVPEYKLYFKADK